MNSHPRSQSFPRKMTGLSYISLLSLPLLALTAGCSGNHREKETERTDSLLQSLKTTIITNPAEADSIIGAAQRQTTDSAAWYRMEIYRSTAIRREGDTVRSRRMYDAVERWCRANPGHEEMEAQLWNNLGVNAIIAQNMGEALVCLKRAFTLYEEHSKTTSMLPVAINLADAYQQNGKLPESAYYYRYALHLCDSLHCEKERMNIYSGLANVYTDLENFNMAHHFFDLAARRIEKEPAMTRSYYYMTKGNCLFFEGNYAEAAEAFRRALTAAEEAGHMQDIYVANCNLGETYLMTDNLAAARRFLNRASEVAETFKEKNISYYYLQSLLANLSLAEGHRAEGLRLIPADIDSLLGTSPRYLMLHYLRRERYAVRSGLWEEAYACRMKRSAYADTLRNSQVQSKVLEMEMRYNRDSTLLSQKLAIADYKAQAAQHQTKFVLLALLAIVLTVIVAGMSLLFRRRTQQRLKRQREKITELRMDIVRNRVSPHYIFNVLGTILPKLRPYPGLAEPLELLIDVLRGNLLSSRKMSVPLRDEIVLVSRYVELNRYSRGEAPEVIWDVDDALRDDMRPVPAMSLQIPVENALKHAFSHITPDSRIDISIRSEAGGLRLSITDNGNGYNPGSVPSTGRDTGTGLRLLSRATLLLNPYNQREATFSITDLPAPGHGTRVELFIPDGYRFELPEAAD